MMIRQLPDNVRSYLRSGVAITSVTQCVEELFLNAVDAGATCVAVRVDLDVFRLQVVDNGQGLPADQLDMLGERYCTSKCHLLSDLNKLSHFGYRGEALASIRESCGIMEVTTRPKTSTKTYCKMFQNGAALKVTDSTIPRPSSGTTITVHDLFKNFPVRRKATHTGLEIERIKQRLEGLALLKPHISVSLRNDLNGNVILQTHKSGDTIKTFSYLYGAEKSKSLVAVEGMNAPFTVKGYIGITAHTKKDLQFVYINGRVVLKTKVHKMVNQAMGKSVIFKRGYGQNSSTPEITQKQSLSSSPTKYLDKHPFYVLDVTCPLTEYDITFDPAKTLVEFKDWSKLLQCINDMVNVFLKKEKLDTSPDIDNSPEVKGSAEPMETGVDTDIMVNNRISPSNMRDTISSKKVKRQKTEDTQEDFYTTPQTVSIEEWKASYHDNQPAASCLSDVQDESNSTVLSTDLSTVTDKGSSSAYTTVPDSYPLNNELNKSVNNSSNVDHTKPDKQIKDTKVPDESSKISDSKMPLPNSNENYNEATNNACKAGTKLTIPSTQASVTYSSLSSFKKALNKTTSKQTSRSESDTKEKAASPSQNMLSSLQRFRNKFSKVSCETPCRDENPLGGEDKIKPNRSASITKLKPIDDEKQNSICINKLIRNKHSQNKQFLKSEDRENNTAFPQKNPNLIKPTLKEPFNYEQKRENENQSIALNRKRMVNSTYSGNTRAAKIARLVKQKIFSVSVEPESSNRSYSSLIQMPTDYNQNQCDETHCTGQFGNRSYDSNQLIESDKVRSAHEYEIHRHIEPYNTQFRIPDICVVSTDKSEQITQQKTSNKYPSAFKPTEPDKDTINSQDKFSISETTICDMNSNSDLYSLNYCARKLDSPQPSCSTQPDRNVIIAEHTTALDEEMCINEQGDAPVFVNKSLQLNVADNDVPVLSTDSCTTISNTLDKQNVTSTVETASEITPMFTAVPINISTPVDNINNEQCFENTEDIAIQGNSDPFIVSTLPFTPKLDKLSQHINDYHSQGFKSDESKIKKVCPTPESQGFSPHVDLNISTDQEESASQTNQENDMQKTQLLEHSSKETKDKYAINTNDNDTIIRHKIKQIECLDRLSGLTRNTLEVLTESDSGNIAIASAVEVDGVNGKYFTDRADFNELNQVKTSDNLSEVTQNTFEPVLENDFSNTANESVEKDMDANHATYGEDSADFNGSMTVSKHDNTNTKDESATQDLDDTYAIDVDVSSEPIKSALSVPDSADMMVSEEVSVTQLLNGQTSADTRVADTPLSAASKGKTVLFSEIFSPTEDETLPSLCNQCDRTSNPKESDLVDKNQGKGLADTDKESKAETNELPDCSWNSSWSSIHELAKENDAVSIEGGIHMYQRHINNKVTEDVPQSKVVSHLNVGTSLHNGSSMATDRVRQSDRQAPNTDRLQEGLTEMTNAKPLQCTPLLIENRSTQESIEMSETGQWMEMMDPISGKKMFVHSKSGATVYDSDFQGTVKEMDTPRSDTIASFGVKSRQTGSVRIQVPGSSRDDVSLGPSSTLVDMVDQYLQKEEEEGVDVKWRTPAERDKHEKTENTVESIFSELNDQVTQFQNKELMKGEISDLPSRALVNAYKSMHTCTFTKDMLNNVKVVGQLDKKFIACLIDTGKQVLKTEAAPDMLAVIDQHAAHERIRLEMLTEEAYMDGDRESGQLCRYTVTPPKCITFTEDEVRIMITFTDEFKRIGIILKKELQSRVSVQVHSVPECLVVKEDPNGKRKQDFIYWDTIEALIKDHVELLRSSGGSRGRLPKVIHKILCSIACHGAIKFGDPLTLLECEALIKDLALCDLPFQCAHGRPSVMPVLPLDQLHTKLGKQKQNKPKLYKLKAAMVPEREKDS